MPVRNRITLLFTLLVVGILSLVCSSVYYFSYTNRIKDIQTRLANRAITTGRLLSQGGIFDQALIRKIDASTSVALRDKIVEAYDNNDNRVYWYADSAVDTLHIDTTVLGKARASKESVYFKHGEKDAIAYYYNDGDACFVMLAAAYDEQGNEKLRHLRLVLSLSFIGGILTSIIGGYLFSISLLYPLRRIADEVNEISARNLARRVRGASGGSRESRSSGGPGGSGVSGGSGGSGGSGVSGGSGGFRSFGGFGGFRGSGDEWDYLADTLNQLLNRLQQSFEIQGRFIANASHELSTPLTSISSQLEVALQRARTPEEYQQIISSVYQDTRQLSKLTQTLLEFARASGTAAGLEIDLIRIDEILLRLPGEIGKANSSFGVTLDFIGLPEAEEELLVFGNEELLFTAIRNIVSNACKYSDDHHAIVRLSVEGKEIRISVEDRGKGINPEEWENIFQPFYRSDDGVGVPGFGLGLSLARRILQLHKGFITVDSVVGKGSIFYIRLPVAGSLKA